MNEIAFFLENSRISYAALFVAFGTAVAMICSILTSVLTRHRIGPVMLGASVSMITGVLFSRIVYWYCCPEQFNGFFSALTDLRSGGFSLVGVFIGVFISALIVRFSGLADNLLALLDCYAPGAALGIAIGRLGSFFSNDDKGNFLFTDEKYHQLPVSVAIEDSVTGAVEWRFASFFWESMAGFAILAALLLLIGLNSFGGRSLRHGDLFMAFISLFGATQAALESTRYDALHMRSNGFISMMQMAALIMLVVPMAFYCFKLIRAEKSIKGCIIYLGIYLLMLSAAGVSEYFIQRKANYSMIIFPLQMISLLVCSVMTLLVAVRLSRVTAANCSEVDSEAAQQG